MIKVNFLFDNVIGVVMRLLKEKKKEKKERVKGKIM